MGKLYNVVIKIDNGSALLALNAENGVTFTEEEAEAAVDALTDSPSFKALCKDAHSQLEYYIGISKEMKPRVLVFYQQAM